MSCARTSLSHYSEEQSLRMFSFLGFGNKTEGDSAPDTRTVNDFTLQSIKLEPMPLKDLLGDGKVALIVNTASKCGLTYQYAGLESTYQKFKDRGFVVIGTPCNQFGGQEPYNEEKINDFVCEKFKVSFPMSAKVDVNGPNAHPLWVWMKSQHSAVPLINDVSWNFEKVLIDKHGKVYKRFNPVSTPESLDAEIDQLLMKE